MNSKAAQLRDIENEETKAMSTNAGQQQVAIVTGASSGLGLGITRALLQRGFRVVANSRTISKSKELKPSADLVLVDGDIGIKETASKVAEAAVSHFGRIDLLVNNAGIYVPKPFTEYTSEDFETNIRVNVAGYFFVTQQAVAQMRKQKSGHIVSISAVVVDQPLAGAHNALPIITNSTIPAFKPRPGDGIRGRGDSGQHDLARRRGHANARSPRPRGPEKAQPDSTLGSNLRNRGCSVLLAIGTDGERRKHSN